MTAWFDEPVDCTGRAGIGGQYYLPYVSSQRLIIGFIASFWN